MALSSRQDQKVVPFTRSPPPKDTDPYVTEALRRVEQTLGDLTSAAVQVWNHAPTNPRRAMIVYAVSPWNPGSGEGLYVYKGSLGWKFIV